MASTLAELVVALSVEASKFTEGINKSQKQLADFQRSVVSAVGDIATLFGVGFSADKIVEFSGAILESAASLEKLSVETGASVEALSNLQNAAKITGVDDLGQALARLSKSQGEVAQGNKQITGVFSALGIAAQDVLNLKPDQLILRIADSFERYADGAGKSAAAQELFGRNGQTLIPLLDQGATGLKALADEAARLGGQTSTEFAKAAEEFEGDLARLKIAATAAGQGIVQQLLPALDDSVQAFTTFITESKGAAEGLQPTDIAIKALVGALLTLGLELETVAQVFNYRMEQLGLTFGFLGASAVQAVKGNFSQAHDILQAGQEDLQKLSDDYHKKSLNSDAAYGDALGKLIDGTAQHAIDAAKKATSANFDPFEALATANLPEMKPQLVLPDTSAIDQLQKALQSLQQKAAALNLSDGLKPTELETAKAALQFGSLSDAVKKAADQGPIFAAKYLAIANVLSHDEAAADVKKLTDSLQQQIDTFGEGSIAVAKYADSHGELGKVMDIATQKNANARLEYEALITKLATKQDAVALVQLNEQLETLRGNSAAAAAQLFDLQHAAQSDNFSKEGNAAGLAQLQNLKDATVAQAAFNDEQQKAATINTQLQAQLTAIAAAQANGSETDLQAMADQDTARQGAIAQLTEIQTQLDGIARLSGLPALKNQALQAKTGITELQSQTDQLAKTLRGEFTDNVSSAFTDFVTGAKSAGDAFAELLGDIEKQLLDTAIKSELQSLFSTGSGGGFGSIFTSLAGAFTGGGNLSQAASDALGSSASSGIDALDFSPRADGGPVTAGKSYFVGEDGPEPFIPSTNGTILPTGSLGGQNVTINLHIQAPNGTVSKATQQQVAAAAARGLTVANARNN